MIHSDSRSMEWINHISSLHPSLDKTLIEKSIRAFSLLNTMMCFPLSRQATASKPL